ncbi:PspA/IM30 family protein [Membranihabitans maritimus]|uniref:PspA/IM30 family protein n=1 Tax=Membranihabitans maritimus TaxID=2904244 RepID=UPI001F3223DD|nr:PspA/IM30 family protein [Membranihabitans maritimus]
MSSSKVGKSFWQRPEGVTGGLILGGIIVGVAFLVASLWPFLIGAFQSGLGLAVALMVLGVVLYLFLDPKMRNLIWYFYKNTMRWITGLFVKIDPISILKSYISDLQENVKKMHRQIAQLRGQMHQLKEMIYNNQKQIKANLVQASEAKARKKRNVMILKSRKAGRLKESNVRLEELYNRMEILYRVLRKMYENSEILLEDVKDQVFLKDQERKAIIAGQNAMRSAMDIIKGDEDKKELFDKALEAVADDVSQKVGEMEEFMEMSEDFMNSIDLQNGVFEEKGLELLEKWEKESESLLLGPEKEGLLLEANDNDDILDLNQPVKKPIKEPQNRDNQYDSFFD